MERGSVAIRPTTPARVHFAIGLAILAMATSARAQRIVLEPFTIGGPVVVREGGVAREDSGVEIVLTGSSSAGPIRVMAAHVPGPAAGWTAQLVRHEVGTTPIRYGFASERGGIPLVWVQSGTRAFGEPLGAVDSPASGDLTHPIMFDDLCSLPVRLLGLPGQQLGGFRVQFEADDAVARAEYLTEVPADTPLREATGYVVEETEKGPVMIGEALVRRGRSYRVSGTAVLDGATFSFESFLPWTIDDECRLVLAGGGDGGGGDSPVLEPHFGHVRATLRLRTEPDDDLAPTIADASFAFEYADRRPHVTHAATVTNGIASMDARVSIGTWLMRPQLVLSWPDGRHQRLELPFAAEPYWSPLRQPSIFGTASGLYPDMSIVLTTNEQLDATYDAPLAYVDGALSLSGCASLENLAAGEVFFAGDPPDETSRTFTDVFLGERRYPNGTEGGGARTSIHTRTGQWVLAVPPGRWRQSGYGLYILPDGQNPTALTVELDEPPLTLAPGRSAALERTQALSIGTVAVRLSVRNPDGSLRPFRRPSATIAARPAHDESGAPIGTYESHAIGYDQVATEHTVRIFALPGVVTIGARGLVPANPDGTGPESDSAFPPLVDVPILPPRPDGSCVSICADSVEGTYWEDDGRGPTVMLDPLPLLTRAETIEVTGRVRDASPIDDRLTVNGIEVMLAGSSGANERTFSVTIPLEIGPNLLRFEARDRCASVGRHEAYVDRIANRLPTLLGPRLFVVEEGDTFVTTLSAFDPEGDPVTVSLGEPPEGMAVTFDPESGELRWETSFEDAGEWHIPVVLSDTFDAFEETLVVQVLPVNRPPVFVAIDRVPPDPLETVIVVAEGERLAFEVEAMDPDGDPLLFTLVPLPGEPLPDGLALSSEGEVTWQTDYTHAGDYRFELAVADPHGARAFARVLVRVLPTNRAPTYTGPLSLSGRENEPIEATLDAHDPDGDPLTWTLLPAAVASTPALDPTTGHFTWTPDWTDAGTHAFDITLSDGEATLTITLVVEVENVNRAPEIVSIGAAPTLRPEHSLSVREDTATLFPIVARDPDGEPVTLTLEPAPGEALPATLALDPETHTLRWMLDYDAPRSAAFLLVARDPSGASDTVRVTLAIEDVNRPPIVDAPERVPAIEGVPVTVGIAASDLDGDPVSLSIAAAHGALPRGMAFDGAEVTWTPDFESAGRLTILVVAEDDRDGRTTAPVVFEIADVNRAPVLSNVGPFDTTRLDGSAPFGVFDPDGDPVTCRLAGASPLLGLDDERRRLHWPAELPDGELRATLTCSDGMLETSAEVVLVTRWGVLVGGCGCGPGGAPGVTLVALLALALRRRRAGSRASPPPQACG